MIALRWVPSPTFLSSSCASTLKRSLRPSTSKSSALAVTFWPLRDDIVDHIREKQALTDLAPEEQTVVNFTRELLKNRKVSKATFDAATAQFGLRGTMTLTNLIACYAVLAYNMNTYELEAPTHATEPALPA
jgi:hypothetical protein